MKSAALTPLSGRAISDIYAGSVVPSHHKSGSTVTTDLALAQTLRAYAWQSSLSSVCTVLPEHMATPLDRKLPAFSSRKVWAQYPIHLVHQHLLHGRTTTWQKKKCFLELIGWEL